MRLTLLLTRLSQIFKHSLFLIQTQNWLWYDFDYYYYIVLHMTRLKYNKIINENQVCTNVLFSFIKINDRKVKSARYSTSIQHICSNTAATIYRCLLVLIFLA